MQTHLSGQKAVQLPGDEKARRSEERNYTVSAQQMFAIIVIVFYYDNPLSQ